MPSPPTKRTVAFVFTMAVFLCFFSFIISAALGATIFGTVRGIIRDPSDRSIPAAQVTIRSRTSNWFQSATPDVEAAFEFNAVPAGEYTVSVTASGFGPQEQNLTVVSGSAPVLRFAMKVAGIEQAAVVSVYGEFLLMRQSAFGITHENVPASDKVSIPLVWTPGS
jgi:hypothetical protein